MREAPVLIGRGRPFFWVVSGPYRTPTVPFTAAKSRAES
jgi:hypothetical protein